VRTRKASRDDSAISPPLRGPIPQLLMSPRIGDIGLIPALPILVLLAFVVLAVGAPLIAPYSPIREHLTDSMLAPAFAPGGVRRHLLGTDLFGRDVLSRLIYGARISLSVSALALLIGTAVGTPVGLIAGFVGGWVDTVLMRVVDVMLSFPLILAALALAVALGPSFSNVVIVIGLLIWPRFARQIRGEAMVLKDREFVQYARAIAVPSWVIMLRHVLPNVMPSLLVLSTLQIGHVILLEASLSFLGAGVPPPQPSWGVMVSEGSGLVRTGWWIALFPGLAILLTVLSFNTLGDWLRDHLDPSLKER
jgi:peptide/nickel transport system permease protein